MMRVLILACACALDALLGDPYSMPHIIRLIGTLIERVEAVARRLFPATPSGERLAGAVLVAGVASLACAIIILIRHIS